MISEAMRGVCEMTVTAITTDDLRIGRRPHPTLQRHRR